MQNAVPIGVALATREFRNELVDRAHAGKSSRADLTGRPPR